MPPADAEADVQFVVDPQYSAGSSVEWVLRNDGDDTYVYPEYAFSCSVELYAQDGRRLWLGSCQTDARFYSRLEPGQSAQAGRWNGKECTAEERSGYTTTCTAWRDPGPGRYEVRRVFCKASDASIEGDCSSALLSGARFDLV